MSEALKLIPIKCLEAQYWPPSAVGPTAITPLKTFLADASKYLSGDNAEVEMAKAVQVVSHSLRVNAQARVSGFPLILKDEEAYISLSVAYLLSKPLPAVWKEVGQEPFSTWVTRFSYHLIPGLLKTGKIPADQAEAVERIQQAFLTGNNNAEAILNFLVKVAESITDSKITRYWKLRKYSLSQQALLPEKAPGKAEKTAPPPPAQESPPAQEPPAPVPSPEAGRLERLEQTLQEVLAAQQALSRQQQALAAQTESLAAQLAAQVSEWQQLSTTLQEKMRALDGLHHSALEPRVDEIESALEAIREQLGPLKDFTWNVVVQNLLKSAVLEEANLNRLHTTPLLSAEAIGLLDTLAQKALPDNSKASADAWWWRVVPLRKK